MCIYKILYNNSQVGVSHPATTAPLLAMVHHSMTPLPCLLYLNYYLPTIYMCTVLIHYVCITVSVSLSLFPIICTLLLWRYCSRATVENYFWSGVSQLAKYNRGQHTHTHMYVQLKVLIILSLEC